MKLIHLAVKNNKRKHANNPLAWSIIGMFALVGF